MILSGKHHVSNLSRNLDGPEYSRVTGLPQSRAVPLDTQGTGELGDTPRLTPSIAIRIDSCFISRFALPMVGDEVNAGEWEKKENSKREPLYTQAKSGLRTASCIKRDHDEMPQLSH